MLIPYAPIPILLDSAYEFTTRFQGMTLVIETPKGELRHGKGWSHKMPADYGYIDGTVGADGDEMDCYVGLDLKSETAFIVDQNQKDNPTQFDEHKVMLGYDTEAKATKDYLAGHTHGEKIFRGVMAISIADLKRWLKTGDITKPVSKPIANDEDRGDNYRNSPTNKTFINTKDFTGKEYSPMYGDFAQKSFNAQKRGPHSVGRIRLHGLKATQPTVLRSKVEEYSKNWDPKSEPIKVNQYRGERYISNGHHRVAAALNRGETHLEGRVWDLDRKD